jgi:hypothetical protein
LVLAVTVNNDDSGPFTSAVGFLTSKPLTSSKLMDFTEKYQFPQRMLSDRTLLYYMVHPREVS